MSYQPAFRLKQRIKNKTKNLNNSRSKTANPTLLSHPLPHRERPTRSWRSFTRSTALPCSAFQLSALLSPCLFCVFFNLILYNHIPSHLCTISLCPSLPPNHYTPKYPPLPRRERSTAAPSGEESKHSFLPFLHPYLFFYFVYYAHFPNLSSQPIFSSFLLSSPPHLFFPLFSSPYF